MKISINDKKKPNGTLKGLHPKTFLLFSSDYSVEYLYKILKNNQRIINNKDENNETFLSYAIKRKNIKIINLLLTSPLLDYSYQNLHGNSYLHLSVIYELESTIKILIEKGIDINMKNDEGNTALHYAYSVNNFKIIILLLQNKIDFTIKNNQGLKAEEIKPFSLKKDELIVNNNNQINKSIIIDWENNITNVENNIDDDNDNDNDNDSDNNENKYNYLFKSKSNSPLIYRNINKLNKKLDTFHNGNGYYKYYRKTENEGLSKYPFKKAPSEKNVIKDYNNTEKINRRFIKNNLLDSKQETIRNNIFESKILPSSHQVNWHICDLNYLNNYHKNTFNYHNNHRNKKISKSQYVMKGKHLINLCSPLKINNRYDLSSDSEYDSDISYHNSARLINKDRDKLDFCDEIKIIKENNIITRKNNNNTKVDNIDNNNDSINQKSTNDSFIQNNLPLYHFLSKIYMEKYFYKLHNNGFDDINLLISQAKSENPITDSQLKEIGIVNAGDRARILIRLEENANNFWYALPKEVYYICENINNININEDINVNKLLEWLNKINVGEYLDNFLINGYYSIELLLAQMISKNPLTDDILKNEIEINKIGHRSRILNKLIEESKEFVKKLKKKAFFITYGKEAKSCECIIF